MTAACIVATYNGEKYIAKQIQSLLGQTRAFDKIFIFDDCSTDKTFEICKSFENTPPPQFSSDGKNRFQTLIEVRKNKKNLGYRKNFEAALLCAREYDIIFFCDQDDFWLSHKVEFIANKFESCENLLCFFSNAFIADENLNVKKSETLFDLYFEKKKQKAFKKNPQKVLLGGATVTGCTMAIRNTLVSKVVPFSKVWVHDEWIAAAASFYGKIDYTNEPLIKYRQHAGQAVGTKKKASEESGRHDDRRGFEKIAYAITQAAAKERLSNLDFYNSNLNKKGS